MGCYLLLLLLPLGLASKLQMEPHLPHSSLTASPLEPHIAMSDSGVRAMLVAIQPLLPLLFLPQAKAQLTAIPRCFKLRWGQPFWCSATTGSRT